ncbi:hypothetical protein M422DRAFT_42731 [Sphaerobolus stellatus SS14]|nr:hypothetical protein M422DRAFT_42731 [Sphaerobolus stellatus SS14]
MDASTPPKYRIEKSIGHGSSRTPTTVEAFDFDLFFQKFDLESPISNFVESFSIEGLHRLVEKTFSSTMDSDTDNFSTRSVLKACRELENELQNIDAGLKIMAGAQLKVSSYQETITQLRELNKQKIQELKKRITPNGGPPMLAYQHTPSYPSSPPRTASGDYHHTIMYQSPPPVLSAPATRPSPLPAVGMLSGPPYAMTRGPQDHYRPSHSPTRLQYPIYRINGYMVIPTTRQPALRSAMPISKEKSSPPRVMG